MKKLKTVLLISTLSLFSTAALAGNHLNFLSGKNPSVAETNVLTPAQTKEVEKIIRRYLVKNPAVLVDVFEALRQQEAAEQKTHINTAISKHATQIFHAPFSPVIGNDKGDITLVEFLDYRCQHCKEMGITIAKLLQTDPNLRVVIKQLPIFGQDSEYAAKAALASQQQGKFQAFHEALLKAKMPLNKTTVTRVAKRLGLNLKQLNRDIKSPAVQQQMKDNVTLAEALAIAGTPAFIIADRTTTHTSYMMGAIELSKLKAVIDAFRGKTAHS